ncbi:hypothetical protein OAI26_07985, partial [Sulfitobacter sp.]|nr:hypothetical protein [Sulfitobacter sp.]
MSPFERKALVNRDHTDLSLTKQCKLLKISRSSLYYTPVGEGHPLVVPQRHLAGLDELDAQTGAAIMQS